MTRQKLLADSITETRTLLGRYLRDFDDSNHTRQAPGLPNHVAWSLGHLALTMHRVAQKLDGKTPPATDFVEGATCDAGRFATEAVSFGSKPTADAKAYPPFVRCNKIFSDAIDRLSSACLASSDSVLDSMTKWGAGETTLGSVAMRMVFHNGTHCGQIADLRRALGMGSIFA